ncbi:MAG: DNA gyrase/topoisomerase IV subunit A [Cytophagales bacterium]|nr:MAG: DNA gyrase/topoisomerase IV subunit A [Cytophagales bacterium]TAF61939.1 MAG: DNA gyrase/topoisomerase IV subunit A [Cytophagales bacterium]
MQIHDNQSNGDFLHDTPPVQGMYESWFLDYASYVILDRAIPHVLDGLKPVQRRILFAMNEMDDGRYHKVANIIGQTMQFHPHGDASIGDALVHIGQKDLLIDTQGNWGDYRTGDSAAAPRYIEARLSKFALEVLFNADTTQWQQSYDGRKKEPITLPVKFPLLLAQGVEGIAVGLSTKILPHNFNELIEASIACLKGEEPNLLPDFQTAGLADFSLYNGGMRGGKVRVRAKIEELDKKTLVIKEIPYGTTTEGIKESIVKAADAGKIKIKKVLDNTAKDIELAIQLIPGTSTDVTMSALYAFTDCEVSISPNACVIIDNKPHFTTVNELLKVSTESTKNLLKAELTIKRNELKEKLLFASLERIFIEYGIYRLIEEAGTWEEVIRVITEGVAPYTKDFYRPVTEEDIVRLTEIKIKRISKYDAFKAEDLIQKLNADLREVERHLADIVAYTIRYFSELKTKYGKDRLRQTKIMAFDTIQAAAVVANNAKLYVNRKEGFVGMSLKKDELVCDCSDIDDIVVFLADGTCQISKIADKLFVGKDIIHVGIYRKNDERMVYHLAYLEPQSGRTYVKRFQMQGITRDRPYKLASEDAHSKVYHFSANPNGESEIITVYLSPNCKAKNKIFDFDFADLDIKGRNSQGNILTKYPVKRIKLKSKGRTTLDAVEIFYDVNVGTLNKDKMGKSLGRFEGEDQILVIYKSGDYELTNHELTNRYEADKVLVIEKMKPETTISAIYYDAEDKLYYLKRFKIETNTLAKKFNFIGGNPKSMLTAVSTLIEAEVEVSSPGAVGRVHTRRFSLSSFEEVKGWKAIGRKLDEKILTQVQFRATEAEEDVTEKLF